jgi:chromosomal replication initiator protein
MDEIDTKTLWSEIAESLKVSVSPAIYSTWFSQTRLSSLKKVDNRYLAEIGCSSSFVKSTIETRYFGLLQDLVSKSLNCPCDLLFNVQSNLSKNNLKDADTTPLFEERQKDSSEVDEAVAKSRLRVNFTFSNFAVSSSNQMAWAAADAVSKNPGSAYNPLFIWGGVGVGKTHLMSAVGHAALTKDSSSRVYFCTGEDFTNDIVEGIRNKTTQKFRDKYRRLNLLLIDDIQFIAGKDAVQEEFFHTFNALVATGGQIILTSDKHPSEISRLEERLRSRFEAGLIVDIAPPDFELRCAILQIKTKQRGIELPQNLVHLIAGNVDTSRKIEGFIVKLMSAINLKNTSLNEELVESLIGKGEGINSQKIKANPVDIINAVCKYYSLGKRTLLGESRARPIAQPRQLLMYLLRTYLSLPLEEVGRIVGGRDHTTVMHAVEKITQMASDNVQIREDLVGIKNML